MKKVLFIMTLATLISTSAYAAKKYAAQGCGLGSTFFKSDTLMDNVLGATTNGSSGNQTFGMTSGTSNCEVGAKSSYSQTVFIKANKVALKNDIARGNGRTIASLGKMYGCHNTTIVGETLQQNYKRIFPTENVTAEEINQNIQNVIVDGENCKI